jgi:hypothetical protein
VSNDAADERRPGPGSREPRGTTVGEPATEPSDEAAGVRPDPSLDGDTAYDDPGAAAGQEAAGEDAEGESVAAAVDAEVGDAEAGDATGGDATGGDATGGDAAREEPWPPTLPDRPVTFPPEYGRLQRAIRRLVEEVAGYRARVRVAEDRAREFEKTLKDVSTGALDPMKLRREVRRLEEENTELRRRMVKAQDRIRHLIARFDFLREEM